MENFLKAKIGSQLRTVKITEITKEKVTTNDRESEKIVFTVWDDTIKREFKISDCWIRTNTNDLKIAGLWYLISSNDTIAPNSALAKLLTYYKMDAIIDLTDKEVKVYPDPKDYLVLVGCDCSEKELDNKLKLLKH